VIFVVGDDDCLVVGGSVVSGDIGVDGVCSLSRALGRESHASNMASEGCKSSGILQERICVTTSQSCTHPNKQVQKRRTILQLHCNLPMYLSLLTDHLVPNICQLTDNESLCIYPSKYQWLH